MKRFLLMQFLFVMVFNISSAQDIFLGVQTGYESTFRNEKIGEHANYSAFFQIRLSADWHIRIQPEFYTSTKYLNQYEYEYQGTTYIARDGQLWKNHILNIEVKNGLFKNVYWGAGMSGHLIKFKKVVHNPFWPIRYMGSHGMEPNIIEDRDIYLVRFGLCGLLGWEQSIWNKLGLLVEMRYSLIFMGDELGYGPWNTLESAAVFGGLQYGF